MNEWMMHLYSAFCVLWYTALQSCGGVSPQPPPVCSIHLDDATAATGQRRQCAHHTSYRWRGEREIEPIKWILHQIVSITKLNATKMLWIYLTKQIKVSGEFILIFVMKFIGSSKQNNYWSTLNNANIGTKENEKQLKSIHFFKKITFAYSWIKPKYHDDVYILNISLLLQKKKKKNYIYIYYSTCRLNHNAIRLALSALGISKPH